MKNGYKQQNCSAYGFLTKTEISVFMVMIISYMDETEIKNH